jgi:hypothetical protein
MVETFLHINDDERGVVGYHSGFLYIFTPKN